MKELIERKNKLLRSTSDKLSQLPEIASLLEDSNNLSYDNQKTLTDLVATKLRNLALGWSEAFFESQIELPEAKQEEPTIDEEAEVTENDLPFC